MTAFVTVLVSVFVHSLVGSFVGSLVSSLCDLVCVLIAGFAGSRVRVCAWRVFGSSCRKSGGMSPDMHTGLAFLLLIL